MEKLENNKIKKQESSLKPEFKLADEYLDLRTMDTNIIVDYLEEQIKLREAKADERFAKQLRKGEVTKQ